MTDSFQDVPENTVVAGNPAKPIRRVEPGANNPERRHAWEIQQRNEAMMERMIDYANNGYNSHSKA